MENKQHFTVVAGLIWRSDGFILISKRLPSGSQANKWELPGGKVEEGESLPDALEREIFEELNLSVEAGEEFGRVVHDYGNKIVTLSGIHVLYTNGEPEAREVSEWRWIHPDDLLSYQFPPANERLFQFNWSTPPKGWGVKRLASG